MKTKTYFIPMVVQMWASLKPSNAMRLSFNTNATGFIPVFESLADLRMEYGDVEYERYDLNEPTEGK